MDPSGENTNHQEQFFELLNNQNIRKLYHKVLHLGKKHAYKIANIKFLSRCLEHKVVPNTFRITNQPYGRNKNYHTKWTSAAKCASLSWMKITIDEEEKLLTNIFNQYRDILQSFGSFVPEHLLEYSANLFKEKNDFTLRNLEQSKGQKFDHLAQKTKSVNSCQEDGKNKNKRKFIKKRVWTRRQ